ncbi:MAG: hypothetical protein JO127_05875 [Caulobacteraceae bacterium]|nr:hypothetical protein [Caulobacteraceae bacterium]
MDEDNKVLASLAEDGVIPPFERRQAKVMTRLGLVGLALFAFSQIGGVLTRSFAWWIAVPFFVSLLLIGIAAAYWNPRLWAWMAKRWLP